MSTTKQEREEERALIRTNLRRFIDEVNCERSDRTKTNLHCSLMGLQVISVVNLAETVEAGNPGPP
jgi:hypothetical protein